MCPEMEGEEERQSEKPQCFLAVRSQNFESIQKQHMATYSTAVEQHACLGLGAQAAIWRRDWGVLTVR